MGTGSSGKDAFGPGNGLSHEFGLAMDDEGVTPAMFKHAVSSGARKRSVGAALRGEESPKMDFVGVLERELQHVGRFCEMAKVVCTGDNVIEQTLGKAAEAWGLSDHLRFVPDGLGLPQFYSFLHDFNQKQEEAGLPTLKIYEQGDHARGKEWWRNADVHEPTIAGVSYLDHGMVMRPTDLIGRPFNLPYDPQHAWALEQRGEGLTSAEGTLYHFSRSILEDGRPIWGGGSVRCRNAYGSDCSLGVCWFAGDGLLVGHWGRTDTDWHLGALPWRFIRA